MPNYAVRVELRGNPPAKRYDALHALMAKRGFGRTVTGVDKQGNSSTVDLPHATYYGSSDSDCLSLFDSVSAAIRNEIQQALLYSWFSPKPGQPANGRNSARHFLLGPMARDTAMNDYVRRKQMATKKRSTPKSFDGPQTGSILINLVDGARNPLPAAVTWSAMIRDGRSPDDWQKVDVPGTGSTELVKGLRYFDNLFDAYTVIVSAKGYESAGWQPVHISPARTATVDLMLLEKNAGLNFSGASWDTVKSLRPRFAEILSIGSQDPKARYDGLMEQSGGLLLACALNLLTAMSQIVLPTKKTPIDYYWQPIWDDSKFPMAQDRFFAYVDKALVEDVVEAGKMGAFAEEKDPGTFHPGATLSYKQNRFDVTNIQLTFHQGNQQTIQTPTGPVDCIVVEPDIDFYKDLLAHFFVEVLPNKFTQGKTDPRAVYVLRWMAGKQAASEFNPLYTIVR
jgi:hypothetical protein